jgi:hypothetical protein
VLPSRRIRTQPAGAVIGAVAEAPASTDATSTSPAETVVGLLMVRLEPELVVPVTALAVGNALTARTEPDVVAASAAASATRTIQRYERALPSELRERDRAAPLAASSFLISPPLGGADSASRKLEECLRPVAKTGLFSLAADAFWAVRASSYTNSRPLHLAP